MSMITGKAQSIQRIALGTQCFHLNRRPWLGHVAWADLAAKVIPSLGGNLVGACNVLGTPHILNDKQQIALNTSQGHVKSRFSGLSNGGLFNPRLFDVNSAMKADFVSQKTSPNNSKPENESVSGRLNVNSHDGASSCTHVFTTFTPAASSGAEKVSGNEEVAHSACNHGHTKSSDSTTIEHADLHEKEKLKVASCSGTNDSPRCWSCPVRIPAPESMFCKHCGVLQPPPSQQDYFTMFGLGKPTFDVSLMDLDAKFKSLQRLVHPDRYSTKSSQEQTYSSQYAMSLNAAYTTLKDPLARGRYILFLKEPALLRPGAIKDDPAKLVEILEIREQIDDAIYVLKTHGALAQGVEGRPNTESKSNADIEVANAVRVLVEAYLVNQRRMKSMEVKLGKAFARDLYKRAAQYLSRMSYLCSIEMEIKAHVPWDSLATALQKENEGARV